MTIYGLDKTNTFLINPTIVDRNRVDYFYNVLITHRLYDNSMYSKYMIELIWYKNQSINAQNYHEQYPSIDYQSNDQCYPVFPAQMSFEFFLKLGNKIL